MSFDLQSIFKNIKPGKDGTVLGEISFNTMFQQFLPKFHVLKSLISSPYIYVYLDIPVTDILSTENELAKKLVAGAQLRLTLKEKEIMQMLTITNLSLEGFRQDGDDVLVVVKAKITGEGTPGNLISNMMGTLGGAGGPSPPGGGEGGSGW
jgi:hypothetical protein